MGGNGNKMPHTTKNLLSSGIRAVVCAGLGECGLRSGSLIAPLLHVLVGAGFSENKV